MDTHNSETGPKLPILRGACPLHASWSRAAAAGTTAENGGLFGGRHGWGFFYAILSTLDPLELGGNRSRGIVGFFRYAFGPCLGGEIWGKVQIFESILAESIGFRR